MAKNKNIIIVALIAIVLAMSVGYSALATQLSINGTAEIIGEWDVKITGIVAQDISQGCESGEPTFTNTSATFNAKLAKPGDSITYVITIQNAGTIDAKLDKITFNEEPNGSPAITYTKIDPEETLSAGEETTLTIKVVYNSETTEVPSIKTKTLTGIIEYVQK